MSLSVILVTVAIAILRYRLYEIDLLLRRTLVYGVLTALLGAVYTMLVLRLGQLFGGTAASRRAGRSPASPWPWPPLVQPARRRIQEASTAASTGAVTTRPGRSRRSAAACASRPTSTPWPPSSSGGPPDGGAHHGVALAPLGC
jgi:hypothetical protein